MLVLGRKLGETIVINGGYEAGGITIMFCKQTSTGVRIGIKADDRYTIKRGELLLESSTQPVSEDATPRVQTGQAG